MAGRKLARLGFVDQRLQQPHGAAHPTPCMHRRDLIQHGLALLRWAREYGCASHRDGGDAACTNGIRVPIRLAEGKPLNELLEEMLSPQAIALLQRRIEDHVLQQDRQARAAETPADLPSEELARKTAQIAELRKLMKGGTLSPAVAHAALEKAEEELRALSRPRAAQEERHTARLSRMLPRAAEVLRDRIRGANFGLRDPQSILTARDAVFGMLGGKVPLRTAETQPGKRPFLVARVGLNRAVLLNAAAEAAGCVKSGSGGKSWVSHVPEYRDVELR